MTVKVELGFTPLGVSGLFFTLNDSVKGVLDSQIYILGGEVLSDVSNFVKSVGITRGKSLELDRFSAGAASVTFNNELRTFDPSYTLSPFYGQIQPKRRIRISVDDFVQFDGTVDDWDIENDASGYSVATANAFDATQNLANIFLVDFDPDVALTGARINSALDNINWSADKRDISVGSTELVGDFVESQNVFQYLQTVAQSEPGDLFISREGNVKFVDRYQPVTGTTPALSDDGIGISYQGISTVIGSELLYNNITVTSSAGTANAIDENSTEIFGEIDYNLETLVNTELALENLANFLLNRYAQPRYRINQIDINLTSLTLENRQAILGLDLGEIVKVTFTPSGIPPAFVSFSKVIRIQQSLLPADERLSLGLETLSGVVLVLDDPEFGKLDQGYFLSGPYNSWTLNDLIYGRLSAGMAVS